MHVELRVEARHDLIEGALFYEQQREGLGEYCTDCLFEDFELRVYCGRPVTASVRRQWTCGSQSGCREVRVEVY